MFNFNKKIQIFNHCKIVNYIKERLSHSGLNNFADRITKSVPTLLFSRSRFNSKKGVKKKVQNDSIFGVKFTPVLLTPSEE